jgi:hypothetical protein
MESIQFVLTNALTGDFVFRSDARCDLLSGPAWFVRMTEM